MELTLKESYLACDIIAKRRARNFYYGFAVLPRRKRQAICSMYAFMRYCDDIADSDNPPSSKIEALHRWRTALDDALSGSYGDSRILPAFHDSVIRFNIPPSYFHELIDGAEMDMSINRYRTFDELYQYCYRVASVVGLVCIHIFGFRGEAAKSYAESCGIAFQLTNILRDIKEDADHDRIYLPLEDLERFGYTEHDVLAHVLDSRFRRLMAFETERARGYYAEGAELLRHVDSASRPCLATMMGIYSSLLDKMELRDYDVFSRRAALSTREKLGIAARSTLHSGSNGGRPVLVGPRT